MLRSKSVGLVDFGSLFSLSLTGCGIGVNGPADSARMISGMTGSVHGGQQPIVGAAVKVMAPGLTGHGSAAAVLLSDTTDGNGGFSMPSYPCPANQGLVYMTVTGGNSGSGFNPMSVEAADPGPCKATLQNSFVRLTEVTTVAAAYTLAPFASITSRATNIGISATNVTGLNNTFAVAVAVLPGKPAVDASGNAWIPGPFGGGGYITQAVGLGAPVVAPLSAAVATSALASRP